MSFTKNHNYLLNIYIQHNNLKFVDCRKSIFLFNIFIFPPNLLPLQLCCLGQLHHARLPTTPLTGGTYSLLFFVVQPTQAAWRVVFLIASGVYMVCGGSYVIFSTGTRQAWDSPDDGVTESNDKRESNVARDGMMLQMTHQWPQWECAVWCCWCSSGHLGGQVHFYNKQQWYSIGMSQIVSWFTIWKFHWRYLLCTSERCT